MEKKKTVTYSVSPEVAEMVSEMAEQESRSKSNMVEVLIKAAYQRRNEDGNRKPKR